jgi:hypothetical protein
VAAYHFLASVAQLAEHQFCKLRVTGSSPVAGSIFCGGSSVVERFIDTEEVDSPILSRRTIYRYVVVKVTNPVEALIAVTVMTMLFCQIWVKRAVVWVVSIPVDWLI